jgi:type I restriction enzyme, S subunit
MTHKTYKLSEICHFQGGYSFKSREYQSTPENAYDVFRMGNIARGGGINFNANHAYINKSKCNGLDKFILQKNDLVMSMTDMKSSMALLGHTALIPEGGRFILNQRVGMLRIKEPNAVDIRYLYYFTNLDEHIQNLRSRANSGVQVNLTATAILESLISLPSISEQRTVAGILGALDDKIELNRRMNRHSRVHGAGGVSGDDERRRAKYGKDNW